VSYTRAAGGREGDELVCVVRPFDRGFPRGTPRELPDSDSSGSGKDAAMVQPRRPSRALVLAVGAALLLGLALISTTAPTAQLPRRADKLSPP
jgi:hypothetical protein